MHNVLFNKEKQKTAFISLMEVMDKCDLKVDVVWGCFDDGGFKFIIHIDRYFNLTTEFCCDTDVSRHLRSINKKYRKINGVKKKDFVLVHVHDVLHSSEV